MHNFKSSVRLYSSSIIVCQGCGVSMQSVMYLFLRLKENFNFFVDLSLLGERLAWLASTWTDFVLE